MAEFCTSCGKWGWDDRIAARKSAAIKSNRRTKMKVYRAPCGWWHQSSQEDITVANQRERERRKHRQRLKEAKRVKRRPNA